jgi:hypothetical protein
MLELRLHYLDLEKIPLSGQDTACLDTTRKAKLKLNLIITEEHVLQVEESFIRGHMKSISRDIKSLTH